MASVYNDILDAVVSQVQGLSLVDSAQVKKRKLPTAQESLDTLPLICVVPDDRPGRVRHASFEGRHVEYPVEITIIRANNGDQLTGLDTITDWLQQIRDSFEGPKLNGVSCVWDTDLNPEPPIDRGKVNDNYDYSPTGLTFHTYE